MERIPYDKSGQRRGGAPEEKEPWISGFGEDYNMFLDRFLQGEEGAQQGAPQPATESQPGLRLRGAASRPGGSSSSLEQAAARPPAGANHHVSASDDPAGPSDSLESLEDVGGGSRSGSGISQQASGRPRAEGKPRGKRKLPVPDLESIEDPAERRKQRRLLKNRNTAAASRERKQKELEELIGRTQSLERDNEALRRQLRSRAGEIEDLNAEVARLSGCPSAARTGSGDPSAATAAAAQRQRQQQFADDEDNARLPSHQQEASEGRPMVPGLPLPMPESGPVGQGGMPGLVVGVDGQWLRLRPGYELQGAAADDAPPPQQQQPQQQQPQQQQRRPPRRREREARESDEEDEDLEEPDEAPGAGDDSDWEPDGRSRGRARSARQQRGGSQAWAPN